MDTCCRCDANMFTFVICRTQMAQVCIRFVFHQTRPNPLSPKGPNHLKSTNTSNVRVFVNDSSSILLEQRGSSILHVAQYTMTIPLFSSSPLLHVPPRPPAHQLSLGVVREALRRRALSAALHRWGGRVPNRTVVFAGKFDIKTHEQAYLSAARVQ
jgi:hypothetical protein